MRKVRGRPAPVALPQRLGHGRPRRGLRVRGDGVFEVDHDDVGVARQRLGDHARVRSGRGQHAALGAVDRHAPIPCAAGANGRRSGWHLPVVSASATSIAVAGASLAPVRKCPALTQSPS